jgi:hypothetical protein
VVGDVGEVLEDLFARAGDDDVDGDRVHGAGVYGAIGLGSPPLDRLSPLGVQDDLGALRRPRVARAAELADDRGVAETVDPLADERGSAAVVAAGPIGLQRADALAQELALEVAFGDAEEGSKHGRHVRRRPSASCRQPLVARPLALVFACCISGTAGDGDAVQWGQKAR